MPCVYLNFLLGWEGGGLLSFFVLWCVDTCIRDSMEKKDFFLICLRRVADRNTVRYRDVSA